MEEMKKKVHWKASGTQTKKKPAHPRKKRVFFCRAGQGSKNPIQSGRVFRKAKTRESEREKESQWQKDEPKMLTGPHSGPFYTEYRQCHR
jgi:hypothetical protein